MQSSYIVHTVKLWVDIARQRNWSAESGADARCWMMTSVVGRLRRANEILTTASAFLRYGSARHGVDGRVRRRVQGPFQGRDRPRPGDERHAGTGNPRRAPRRDTRHRQTGEGRGRRARPRGTRVRDGAPNPPHRPRAAGHRNGPKPGITRTKRRKPPHYKSGTKNRPYQCARRHVRTTPRSVMRPGGQRLPAYSSWSIAPENTRFTAGRTTFSDGVRQEFS